MAYQDPQATVEPYDVDAEMQRLLYAGQDPSQPSAAATSSQPQTDPVTGQPATVQSGSGTSSARTSGAGTTSLPAQPGTSATNASAYSNTNASAYSNPGYDENGNPTDDQRGGGGGSAGGGDTGTTPPQIDESSLTTRRNAVLDYYRRYWGRDAAPWEQDYWAKQDTLSLSDIENTLRNAPEARGQTSGTGGGSTTTGGYSKDTDWGAAGNIEGYFKSRGVTPRSGSADYWRGKWNEWGKNDPAYFFQRLAAAEEFGGGGTGSGTGETPPPSTSTTATPPATDPRITKAIEDLLRRGETPVSGDDPAIRAQFNPTAEVMQRNAARSKANASERAFAQGQYGESSTNVANSQIDQAQSLDQAQLMSQLVNTEIAGRRQDVINAIGFAQGEQKTKLQLYLAQLDEAYRRSQLDLDRWNAEVNARLAQERINAGAAGVASGQNG